jgi:hypothetical protein
MSIFSVTLVGVSSITSIALAARLVWKKIKKENRYL